MRVQLAEDGGEIFEIDSLGTVTYYILILFIFVMLLIIREIYEIIMQRKRYFFSLENYIEWFVLTMAFISIMPKKIFNGHISDEALRHIAALTTVELYHNNNHFT